MRLTRKFIAALVIGVALVAVLQGYLDYQREREVFEREMRGEAAALGRALARGVAHVWQREGETVARGFLETATSRRGNLTVRWVWFDGTGEDAPHVRADELAVLQLDQVITVRDPTRPLLLTYTPVEVPLARRGGLEIAQSLERLQSYVRGSLRSELLGSAGAVAVAALLALGLGVVFIGRPIDRLVAKARRVGTGDLSGPLTLDQRDELGELANELNLMCERLAEESRARERATEQLRHADRLTTVGKLASGLAHELGTPLNVVIGRARLIADREVDGQDVIDSARIIAEQAERMTALIRQLLDFARQRPLSKAPVEVTALAGRVCRLVATIAKTANVTLVPPEPDDSLRIEADDGQLTQVLANLVVNAIQATPSGGNVAIVPRFVTQVPPPYIGGDARRWMAIEVRDTGLGLDEATRARVFEPFYTTKEVGDGTGLGLSVSWGLVREHGGWISVTSTPGAGASFTVFIPPGAPA